MPQREIVFDTETTGLDPAEGHRIIQIGAVELEDTLPTGRSYMTLIDPGRTITPDASKIHGLTDADVAGQPTFDRIVEDFLAFVGDAPLVAHNATFDMKFLNAELAKIGRQALPATRFVDTLEIARRRFPGQPASLDALCRRLGVDNSMREQHDALLDCQILAEIYLELLGGRQQGLTLAVEAAGRNSASASAERRNTHPPRPHMPTEAEAAEHAAFIADMPDAIWSKT